MRMTLRRCLLMAMAVTMLLATTACGTTPPAATPAPAATSAPAAATQGAAATAAPAATPAAATAAPAAQAPMKIRIFNRVNAEVGFDNNPILTEIGKRTNTVIEYDAPPINNYAEKLTLLMASGDLPDVVYNWGLDANYEKWAQEGLFIPLDGLVESLPNIGKNVTPEMWEAARVPATGKFHAVPKPNRVNHWGYIINEDWLAKVNMTPPETLDDLRAVAEAFVQQDPDGNGKKDTFAFSTNGANVRSEQYIASAFNFLTNTGWPDNDGSYVIAEKRAGYMEFMTFMREAYSKQWLDPEFFTNKNYADTEKWKQFRIGIKGTHETGAGENDGIKLYNATFNPPLKNQNGERNNLYGPAIWGAWAITSACKDVPRVLEFLDYGHSEEGAALYILGIQGVHYNSFDFATRALDRTTAQQEALKTVTSSYVAISFAFGGDHLVPEVPVIDGALEKFQKEVAHYKSVTKDIPLPVIKVPTLDQVAKDNPDLITKRDENQVKYVVGEMSEADFRKFLTEEYFPKYEAAEKDMQAAVAKALGK